MAYSAIHFSKQLPKEGIERVSYHVHFMTLRDLLRPFPDIELTVVISSLLREFHNICRGKGVQGPNTDFLICAVAVRHQSLLYYMLGDFARASDANRLIMEYTLHDVLLARRSFKPIRFVPPTVLKDEELQSLKVPAFFLVGENERIYSARKSLERLHKVAPHITTALIPGAGKPKNPGVLISLMTDVSRSAG